MQDELQVLTAQLSSILQTGLVTGPASAASATSATSAASATPATSAPAAAPANVASTPVHWSGWMWLVLVLSFLVNVLFYFGVNHRVASAARACYTAAHDDWNVTANATWYYG
jgi:hypothetical protein